DALWIIALTSLLALLLGVWQLRRFASRYGDPVREVAKKNFAVAKWTAAAACVSTVNTQALPVNLTAFAGLSSTAGLGVIRQLLGPLHLLTRPLETYHLSVATRELATGGTPALNR